MEVFYYIEKDVSSKVRGGLYDQVLQILGRAEAVARRCSLKWVFLNISQISQEKTCVGVSFK